MVRDARLYRAPHHEGEVITRLNDRNNTQVPERVRFELNHDRALSFCFDAFSSNAFSSEVDTGSREENAFFYHLGAEFKRKTGTHFCSIRSLEPVSTSLDNALNDRNNTQSLEYM
jgi:hypothetical protein